MQERVFYLRLSTKPTKPKGLNRWNFLLFASMYGKSYQSYRDARNGTYNNTTKKIRNTLGSLAVASLILASSGSPAIAQDGFSQASHKSSTSSNPLNASATPDKPKANSTIDLDGKIFSYISRKPSEQGVEFIVTQQGDHIMITGHNVPYHSSMSVAPYLADVNIVSSNNGIYTLNGTYFVVNSTAMKTYNREELLREGKIGILDNGKYYIDLYASGMKGTRRSLLKEK